MGVRTEGKSCAAVRLRGYAYAERQKKTRSRGEEEELLPDGDEVKKEQIELESRKSSKTELEWKKLLKDCEF